MQVRSTPLPQHQEITPRTDERLVLLKEVDFKWLMAGCGWWVDTDRLHSDPSYAAHWLNLVDITQSDALKDCAALLRAQVGTQH